VLVVTASLWAMASGTVADRAARGISDRLGLYFLQPLLSEIFLLFLVVLGFALLDWIATRGGSIAAMLALPRRAGWQREWGIGAAAGWGMALLAILPTLLTGHLYSRLASSSKVFVLVPLSFVTLLVGTLVEELVFRGYPFRRLVQAIGPTWASLIWSAVFAFVLLRQNGARNPGTALLVEFLFGLVLAMSYLRTYALWMPWGLHFAYRAVVALVIGLPAAGHQEFAAVTDTYANGPRTLTGGEFGPDAAWLTLLVMLLAFAVVFRLTRWYAWEYTHPPIVPGGYEVTVAPPQAHVEMERQGAVAAPALVQILPITPQSRSVTENETP
jgi:membrane protease YdiL (CAAX protease family)